MAIDPQAQLILDYMKNAGIAPVSTLTVERARAQRSKLPPGPAARVADRAIAGPGGPLPIRSYHPELGSPRGGLVYFHGGGFVLGDLDGHDAVCRQLCVDACCVVVSVDYRLAPEHVFPAAVEDAYAATVWVHAHAEELGFHPEKLAVGGDSAGGNLAAVVAQIAKRAQTPPLTSQLLIYPVTDVRHFDRPSYLENESGKLLGRADVMWFIDHYAPNAADRTDPRVSPLAATDLSGLPRALVITAEHDPLRDEGEAYAEALRASGCEVAVTRYPGMIHAFVSLYAFLDQGKLAMKQCSDALIAAFG